MKSLRLLACWCVLGGLAPSAQAYPPAYSAQAIQGQVVDDQTGQPLAGVVVVAQWTLRMQKVLGLPGWDDYVGDASDILKSIETVTDSNGRYVIQAWGPLARPPLRYVPETDPLISAFKGMYRPLSVLEQRNVPPEQSDRPSKWDGKVLRLKRPEGSLEQQAQALADLYLTLVPGGVPGAGNWRVCPRMLVAMQAEIKRLLSLGLSRVYAGSVPLIEHFDAPDRAFLRSLQ